MKTINIILTVIIMMIMFACKNSNEPPADTPQTWTPKIDSLSKTSGKCGDKITIYGRYLNGLEYGTCCSLYFINNGSKIQIDYNYFRGCYSDSTKFIFPDTLSPGKYKIQVQTFVWNTDLYSNEVDFEILK